MKNKISSLGRSVMRQGNDGGSFFWGSLIGLFLFGLLFFSIGTPGKTLILVATRVAVLPGGLFCFGEALAHTLCGGLLGILLSPSSRGREQDKYRSAFLILLYLFAKYLWYFFFFGKMLFLPSFFFSLAELFFCVVASAGLSGFDFRYVVLVAFTGLSGLYHFYLSLLCMILL